MKEDIEKLISHYQIELINEKDNENPDNTKILLIEQFINQLKAIIVGQEPQKKSKNKKNKQKRQDEFIRRTLEPELVCQKRKSEINI